MNRLTIWASLGLALCAAILAPVPGMAQQFPDRNITLVIPFAPGASNDLIGRYLGNELGRLWNATVVVDNKPGAGSLVGSTYVARAKPDGYTLLFMSSSYTTNAASKTDMPYDPVKDLQPVGLGAIGQMIGVASVGSGIATLADAARVAAERKVLYGTSGIGSSTQFSAELFADVAKVKLGAVHYRGGTPALIDIANNQIDLYFGTVTSVIPFVQNKTAIPLAVASKTRSTSLPDVPTVAEAGFAGAESDIWWGVFAPAGTPPDVIAKLNAGINTVMATPEAAKFLDFHGAMPQRMSVSEFSKLVIDELDRWKVVAKQHNIVAN